MNTLLLDRSSFTPNLAPAITSRKSSLKSCDLFLSLWKPMANTAGLLLGNALLRLKLKAPWNGSCKQAVSATSTFAILKLDASSRGLSAIPAQRRTAAEYIPKDDDA